MKEKTKNYIRLAVVLSLFFCSSIFRLLASILFNIEPSTDFNKLIINLIGNLMILSILVFIYRKALLEDIKSFKEKWADNLEIGIKHYFTGLAIMMVSNLVINFILKVDVASNEANVRNLIIASPVISFILTTITAPIVEELIFRKAFADVFKSKWTYILTSGIIFGSLHVLLSFSSVYELLYLIPYCSLGIAFSYIYYESKNIYTSIFIHMFHNGILSIMQIIALGVILC